MAALVWPVTEVVSWPRPGMVLRPVRRVQRVGRGSGLPGSGARDHWVKDCWISLRGKDEKRVRIVERVPPEMTRELG